MSLHAAAYIPWIAALGAVLCLVLVARPKLKTLAGPVCVVSILIGLVLTLLTVNTVGDLDQVGKVVRGQTVTLGPWIHAGGDLVTQQVTTQSGEPVLNDDGSVQTVERYVGGLHADFGYYFDGLTFTMLLVILGIGSLIAIYAMGYMKGDPGYARFFAAMALFIFAMTTLVMADNLLLLFLGWEGVGLCSYLLIGYYYDKPTAVAAAKKAFIVNRIGDFGFLIGIFLCYQVFGTLSIGTIIEVVQMDIGMLTDSSVAAEVSTAWTQFGLALSESPWKVWAIPFMFTIGAFGKSAQIPLFVWLPDAMAGPTPVSALVHAATMVTAGVYLIARTMPLFVYVGDQAGLNITPLELVAIVGALTAIFAGTIALTSNDLKGVFAYSTVSQLGYMFIGLGALSAGSAVFHLVTHAFFKALLFLTAGSVMHALAGTLDIRRMGGLGKKMPVTKWLMFAGCLALAGFPFTAGFFSKDEILVATMARGGSLYTSLAVIGLITALLTAFYTFRLWFIVFTGEEKFEMGDEHHAEDDHASVAEGEAVDAQHHHDEPHEMPWWPMNAPLALLAVGSIVAGGVLYFGGYMEAAIHASSAYVPEPAAEHAGPGHATDADDHGHGHGNLHLIMQIVSGIIAVLGIALAYLFYVVKPELPGKFAGSLSGFTAMLRGKYFIDEFYDRTIVQPLNIIGQVLYLFDQLVIHAVVMSMGVVPKALGFSARPTQHGKLQGYGLGMVVGIAGIALLMLMLLY